MQGNSLVAIAGFLLGGIVVATSVIAAPAPEQLNRKLHSRSACQREWAWAGERSRDTLAQPAREPRAMLLLAVDRRVSGCRVLSPASAWDSVVPEPETTQAPARLQPASGG